MLMGAREEPFLAACLDSLYGAVDKIILNDNSGLAQHANLSVVQQSRLFLAGNIEIIPSDFIGFGPCRELCLVRIRELAVSGDWIIFVDCDEVHPPQLPVITRSILPYLPAKVGIVDGYFYQFFQFPRYITSLDHRHNLMFRFNPAISWQGQVHEQVVNLTGERLVLPYRYFHYGFLKSHRDISAKWALYGSLGDPVSGAQTADPLKVICDSARTAVEFFGSHPFAAEAGLKLAETENAADYQLFQSVVKKQRWFALRSRLVYWKLELKMVWLAWKCRFQLSGAESSPDDFARLLGSL
jgi:hypothetical protein